MTRLVAKYFTMLMMTALTALGAAEGDAASLWGRWGRALTARGPAAPETEVTVEITSPGGKQRTVSGFWDGEKTWGVRFMPDEEGEWRYRTRSQPAVAGLDGETGTFRCRRGVGEDRFLRHGAVRVSENRRYLQHADGTPFFWLGDTVWNGPLLADRESWNTFLGDRSAKRFSVIQFVMAAPWRTAPADAEGQVAYSGRDPVRLHPRFFQRMDERMDAINARGFLAVPVLLWAIRGDENPGWSLPEADAIRLARYMVARYGAHHVVWILPGDGAYTGEVAEKWKRIGRAVFGGREHAPVMLHPGGMQWPFDAFRDEPWMDLIGYQSGHGDDADTLRWIHSGPAAEEWQKQPPRPLLNLEPPYEDHISYQSRRRHTAYNIRRAAYWSLLSAPPAGLTYGAHGIWSWQTTAGVPLAHESTGIAQPWHEAIKLPGSTHMQHLAALVTSLPWWTLRPATDLLATQPGANDPARHVSAARSETGDLALLYLPVGGEVTLKPAVLPADLKPEWFDPRTGERKPAERIGQTRFRAPDDQDWVLLLRKS